MLLEFFPELIRGGPELSTELVHSTKNSLRNFLGMFKVLQILGFWVYRKMLQEFFPELIRGGPEPSTELSHLTKKLPSKFFGYVWSSAVSWILSLSQNFTRLFCITHPGGIRTLNRTFGFEKKNPFKIFWVCLKYCSFLDFDVIEKCY